MSLPSEEICRSVLARLDSRQSTSIAALETSVNLGRTRLGTLLNILEVDGAVERVQGGFVLADRPGPGWQYDHELAASLRELRRAEADQMREWAALDSCRLRYLRESLLASPWAWPLVPAWLAGVVVGVGALRRGSEREWMWLVAFALLLANLAFAVVSGGDWMEGGRFLVPSVAPLALLAARGLGKLITTDVEPVECPCGQTRRAFTDDPEQIASLHLVEISNDSRIHYHKRLTEIYYILEGAGEMELDGEQHAVQAGDAILIKAGCRHRAIPRRRAAIGCSFTRAPGSRRLTRLATPKPANSCRPHRYRAACGPAAG